MATRRAIARDGVDLGKDTLAEAFERERMYAPKHFPIRFLNLQHFLRILLRSFQLSKGGRNFCGPQVVKAANLGDSNDLTFTHHRP